MLLFQIIKYCKKRQNFVENPQFTHKKQFFSKKIHEITRFFFHQKITEQALEPLNKSIFVQWVHGFSSSLYSNKG
jgi:hypothetical protein